MPRKKLVAYAFTFLAALGLGMYLLLPAESELRFLGLIVVIFWLPMALRYLNRVVKERATTLLMPPASSSTPSPARGECDGRSDVFRYGRNGTDARGRGMNAEFLVPECALPRFPVDTMARVLLRDTYIGTVRVLSVNAPGS